jgi:hypothetical protein
MTTLMIYSGAAAPDAPVTRTGGIPLVPPGFVWPRCIECEGTMQFLAQVRLDDVDATAAGMWSVFVCQNDPGMCEDWNPIAGGNRTFVFGPGELAPAAVPAGANVLLGEVSAVGYLPVDGDDYGHAYEQWSKTSDRPATDVLGQLGGSPLWIQDDETPLCESCDRPMSFLVQLEEGHNYATKANFGGGGSGYGFRCRPCATGAFVWQR